MSILGNEEKQENVAEQIANAEVKPDTSDMILTMDADTLAYAVCSICESGDDEAGYIINLEYALEEACKRVDNILSMTGCKSVELHFTVGRNFRFTLTDTYKANRGGQRTPEGLTDLKKLLLTKYPGALNSEFEADDVVCTQKKLHPDKYIVASPDKDVYNGVAGVHVNYFKRNQSKNKYGTILKAIPMKWIETTELEALVWVHMQVLMGDSSDGIAGLDKCGPVKAIKVLVPKLSSTIAALKKVFKKETGKDADIWKDIVVPNKLLNGYEVTEFELWQSVANAYTAAGLDETEAILNMRLVNMHQMGEEGELCLWTQPTE